MSTRLYQINTVCGVGSTGRIAASIARLVTADGGASRIAYGAEQASKELDDIAFRVGTPLERKLHGALIKLLDMDGYGSYFATRTLIADMERFKPDIVHLHNIHGGYLQIAVLMRYLAKKQLPVVWTLHDCWAFTGHCAYFDYAKCDRWKTQCFGCPQTREYPNCYGLSGAKRNYRRKKRLFTSLPNLTLTPCSGWLRGEIEQSYLKNVPVRVVHNGIDLKRFHPTDGDIRNQYGIGDKKLVLAVASDWDKRKGLSDLIAVSGKLPEDYVVAAIGLTQAQIDALPKTMLGIRKTASVSELAQWYTAADVLADPTLEDNMPLVLLEALACGTPVVSYRTGGCGECFDETCGRLVDKGDVDGMAREVIALASQKQQMKDACLRYAQRFDEAAAYAPYLKLYKELCP